MPVTLNSSKLIIAAFIIPWEMKHRMVKALMIPAVISSTISTIGHFIGNDLGALKSIPFGLVQLALYALFAVNCHRLVLIGENAVPEYGLLGWSLRETRFFGWSIGLYVLYILAMVLPLLLVVIINMFFTTPGANNWLEYAQYLALIPATYMMARLSLIFPATAVDERHDIAWALKLSEGNGWKLTIVVGLLPWILTYLKSLLIRMDANALEVFATSMAGFILLAIEIAALSLSYNELSGNTAASVEVAQ